MASLRVASVRSLRSSPPPAMRFLGFFAANIRNTHTRRAYARAADEFVAWCANVACLRSMPSIGAVATAYRRAHPVMQCAAS
jgi:hypothetical protein